MNEIEIEIIDFVYLELFEEIWEFWVKFFENYNLDSRIKYFVVYLLDGFLLKNSLEIVYENYWGYYLFYMILVGIFNRINRVRDLIILWIKMRCGSVMNENIGGVENFMWFIEKEFILYIDNKYFIMFYCILIGYFYVGLFMINMLINYKYVFENYIVIDFSIEWDD